MISIKDIMQSDNDNMNSYYVNLGFKGNLKSNNDIQNYHTLMDNMQDCSDVMVSYGSPSARPYDAYKKQACFMHIMVYSVQSGSQYGTV